MKTLQELYELGINKVSLKSSKARKFLSDSEIKEIRSDKVFFDLFNLMNTKKYSIINCLKSERPFYFAGVRYDISKLSFLKS